MSNLLGRLARPLRAGHGHSLWNRTELQAPESLTVTSPSFVDHGPMPVRHAGDGVGANVSPGLAWTPPPVGTAQLLLVIEDPDVPLARPVVHTAALLAPMLLGVPERVLSLANVVEFVPASFGRRGYFGPRPVRGHGPHEYEFQLYALSRSMLSRGTPESIDVLVARAAGSVLARGRIHGVFERV